MYCLSCSDVAMRIEYIKRQDGQDSPYATTIVYGLLSPYRTCFAIMYGIFSACPVSNGKGK